MLLGVDFSLTATGVCAITEAEAECVTFGSKPGEWWAFGDRPREIAKSVDEWHGEDRPAWVIESPSYMSKGRGHDKVLVGWHMFVDHMIYELGYDPPLLVSPSQVKKFATSKGNASKRDVERAVWRRYPDVELRDDNQADALVLAAIGAAAYGEPFNGALTKYQQEVIEAVRLGKDK
ncbi:hypothetical protein ACSHWG_01065 [Leucobacter sp. Z1108]|uniref:hypothetical protein n=1 Tax=Leucobacter sp. Z1108 TaxID=3439066 RepID=UPI003F3CAEB8